MDLFPDEVHRLSVATWLANAQLRRFSGETRAVDRYKQYASDVSLFCYILVCFFVFF